MLRLDKLQHRNLRRNLRRPDTPKQIHSCRDPCHVREANGVPEATLRDPLMISAIFGTVALVGGGRVCIENGLLGMPLQRRRTKEVYLGRPVRVSGGDLAGVFTELLGEVFGVVAADLEGDDRADVADDGVGGGFVQDDLGHHAACPHGAVIPLISALRRQTPQGRSDFRDFLCGDDQRSMGASPTVAEARLENTKTPRHHGVRITIQAYKTCIMRNRPKPRIFNSPG